jgi:hypothetical protein
MAVYAAGDYQMLGTEDDKWAQVAYNTVKWP